MTTPIEAARRRQQERYSEDGLEEILQAIRGGLTVPLLLIIGGGGMTTLRGATFLALVVLGILLGMYENRLLDRLRERITWPRAGFAEPLPASWSTAPSQIRLLLVVVLVLAVAAPAAGVLMAIGIMPVPGSLLSALRWLPALAGAGMASVQVRDGLRLPGQRHGLVLAPLYLFLGVVSSVLAPRVLIGLALFLAGSAILQVADGLYKLHRFLKLPVLVEPDGE